MGFIAGFIAGSSEDTWHPAMTVDTTTSSYWLNWRFCLCLVWVVTSIAVVSVLLWTKEKGFNGKQESEATLHDDECWRPCLKTIHPAWLLLFRVSAFFLLLVLLIVVVSVDGGSIFYYYTQWTFTLVTIYFGIGSVLSIRGCYHYHKRVCGDKVDSVEVDAEQGKCNVPAPGAARETSLNLDRQPATKWAFLFQIIFQMNAGAVMLTDCVFWFILVPFLATKDYHLNALVISMHTINAIFLLGDTAFNSLRFPWFRIAYFFTWTITYVIFQWVVHACVKLWWPYPFLDLSSPYAPLWYFSVAVMHVPCYGVFAFIVKLKHKLFTRWFPESYQFSG